jgi:hypothetical protein
VPRSPRLAAGRARALGLPTRGTTNPNRLRRVDRWVVGRHAAVLRGAADPVVVDLGYGASPVTTVEMAARLAVVRPDVRVVGVELAPERVLAAQPYADPPRLTFVRGGFELAGESPVLARAMNVLRQYEEPAAAAAWQVMQAALAPGGLLLEGTSDELGRVACWVALDAAGPRTLTLAAHTATLDRPATLAERLPKALIHHNVRGRRIHELLSAVDAAWLAAVPHAAFGPRQRWIATLQRVSDAGWPVADGPSRWRLGELTVPWQAVAD